MDNSDPTGTLNKTSFPVFVYTFDEHVTSDRRKTRFPDSGDTKILVLVRTSPFLSSVPPFNSVDPTVRRLTVHPFSSTDTLRFNRSDGAFLQV